MILTKWPGHAVGEPFELLGVLFDAALTMGKAVDDLVAKCRYKIWTLRRSWRYYCVSGLILLWKSKVLSFIEYRSAALYHAADTVLRPLDDLQRCFLEELGVSELEAMFLHNLAPLSTRRDIAMLGLVHRSARGRGPGHFAEFFRVLPAPE